jgi:enediyne biosynthesis protein E4
MFDADNDGWLDLFVANGHVQTHMPLVGRDEPFEQLPQLFFNEEGRRCVEVSQRAGAYFSRPVVGRGSAAADYDRDGRHDVAVQHLNAPAGLLRNETPDAGQSLQVHLIGVHSNRSGIGAVVDVRVGDTRRRIPCIGSGSYLSCDEFTRTIGLGDLSSVDAVRVSWPSGRREVWPSLHSGVVHRLLEGSGVAE